jgi:hypothetical protein
MKSKNGSNPALETCIPELDEAIAKLCAKEREKPHYVIVGLAKFPKAWAGGIFAFAKTEWNAYKIRQLLLPYAMDPKEISVRHTKWHPEGSTYDIEFSKAIEEIITR